MEGRGGRDRQSYVWADGLLLSEAWHGLDSVGTRVCDTPQLV